MSDPTPPPGYTIDPVQSQQHGFPVAVNAQGQRMRLRPQTGPRPRPDYGPGVVELPNGDIGSFNSRNVFQRIEQGAGGGAPNIPGMPRTQDQGQAQGYARLMADAESSYQRARQEGYNPASWRNGAAGWVEGIPIVDGLAPIIRDEVSDRGRRAELQWADAQLKAMSGAAAPEQEVRRNIRAFFPTPGVDVADAEVDYDRARETAFTAAQRRSGGAAADVSYPGPTNRSRAAMAPAALAGINAAAFGPLQPGPPTQGRPPVLTPEQARAARPGTVFMTQDGRVLVR